MSQTDLAPRAHLVSIGAVWAGAIVAGALIGILAPAHWRMAWLSVALGGVVLASFAVQLGVGRSHGFLRRTALSAVGGFLALGVLSAGFGLAALSPA